MGLNRGREKVLGEGKKSGGSQKSGKGGSGVGTRASYGGGKLSVT